MAYAHVYHASAPTPTADAAGGRAQDLMAYLESPFQDHLPAGDEPAGVMLLEPRTRKLTRIAETRGWNLQQGAMLHWNPLAPDTEILFNYARLAKIRPVFGIKDLEDPSSPGLHPEDDDAFLMDHKTGKVKNVLSVAETHRRLRARHPELDAKPMFFNHTVFSKDGKQDFRMIGPDFFDGDGHCSYSPDTQWIASDKNHADTQSKELLLFHPGRNQGWSLGKWKMGAYLSGDTRCDLHPRFSRDGKQLCFDCIAPDGTRQVHIAHLDLVG
jgi:hypothetical protein